MANRRMFCKDIVGSDPFKLMPLSSQALYFHLGMEADDRGYVDNPITLMRSIGANNGDLEQLISKKFILVRENGLIVIKHWKINNYIQKDRFIETKYKDDLKTLFYDENSSYTENETITPCIQDVSKLDTQDRLGKDRLGKYRDSIGNNKVIKEINEEAIANETKPISNPKPLKNIIEKALELTKQGEHITMSYFDDYGDYLTFVEERDKLNGQEE